MEAIRNDWTRAEIREIYDLPLLELVFKAAQMHRSYHDSRKVQLCTLLSIKTGGCPENCAYCPQSSHYNTGVTASKLMDAEPILEAAKRAKENGSSRFCMGVAWRQVRNSPDFDKILDIISQVRDLGMEVCCCLGMLNEEQAKRLKEAGLYAYNHNIDTSPEYYKEIISTRTFEERIETLKHVNNANLSVCCGGIIGMGESLDDRIGMLHSLAIQQPHPESVPINTLVAVPGTPLENRPPVPFWELLRMIATARIVMPKAMVRMSAGRQQLTEVEQAFCFMAGANSIHTGEKLLVTPTCSFESDRAMLELLGLEPMESHVKEKQESNCACHL